jgi:uncharacterized membrane protein
LRARQIIGLTLIVVSIVLIAIGVYLITYHYTPKLINEPFLPILPYGNPDVYPYTLEGLVFIIMGLIMLIIGVLLLLVKPKKE